MEEESPKRSSMASFIEHRPDPPRDEITELLARVIRRFLVKEMRDSHPSQITQDSLASSPETLLSVTTAVNTPGEQGEHE
jgi:hypothetical protein